MIDRRVRVPPGLVHEQFVATPLTADWLALDHAAYLASPDVIRVHSDGRWPVHGFTEQDDRRLVAKHEADHRARRSFTFLLLDPTRSEGLGCLYLNPLDAFLARAGADPEILETFKTPSAMVTFWIRQDRQHSGLPFVVARAVDTWLQESWPFATYLFRILPAESSSRAALQRLPLREIDLRLPGETRPYLWFQSAGAPPPS